MPPDLPAIRTYLLALQDQICAALSAADDGAGFAEDRWERPDGGGGCSRVLADGALWEKAGVGFSEVQGAALPPSATARRPELAGRPYQAMGVSVVIHPRHPYVPTAHLNVRFFRAGEGGPAVWWFGGGFDLSPCYGFDEDCGHWHRTARAACAPHGAGLYPRFKQWCDEYFYLKHRAEPRGIGGIFFDDFCAPDFAGSFAFWRDVGEAFLPAYLPIVARRRHLPYGERERAHQLHRRGRYAEFNLVLDRGTHFGLHSGGRTESILMSLPPFASWRYGWRPEPGSPEARLLEHYLVPRDWASLPA